MTFSSILDTQSASVLTVKNALVCTAASVILGIVIAALSRIKSKNATNSFTGALALLPVIVQVVIMMVNGNLGAGVAVMGAFSLVRFRSAAGNAREICCIFFAMAVGLATGMGYITFAACMTAVVGVLIVLTALLECKTSATAIRELRIIIPENLDYTEIFDDIFEKYTSKHELIKVKSTNMGSTFELKYQIRLRKDANQKKFIDNLRCRNGNLTIQLGRPEIAAEEL